MIFCLKVMQEWKKKFRENCIKKIMKCIQQHIHTFFYRWFTTYHILLLLFTHWTRKFKKSSAAKKIFKWNESISRNFSPFFFFFIFWCDYNFHIFWSYYKKVNTPVYLPPCLVRSISKKKCWVPVPGSSSSIFIIVGAHFRSK